MSIQYENEVLDNLRLLQKGFSLEKMMQYSEERRSLIGSWDMKASSLRSSSNSMTSPKTGSFPAKNMSLVKEKPSMKHEIVIEAMFPMKLLLRITSKKLNGKYLSFYFKLLTLEKLEEISSGQSLTLTESNVQEMPSLIKKDSYIRLLKEASEIKDASVKFSLLFSLISKRL